MAANWPVAELDAIARLRVVAESTRALLVEGQISAQFEDVWAVASDLERELPKLLVDVRSLDVSTTERGLEGLARGPMGTRARFDIALEPGIWIMQSRFLLGGLAAVPDGESTRVAFLGGFRFPGHRFIARPLRTLARPYGRHVLGRLRDKVI